MGRVPLARRNLLADPRRAALAVGAVAVALLLVLVLDAIFAGAMRQVTAYVRGSEADVIVSQRGVRTMHMSSSALAPDTADEARAAPGVGWVEPIGFATGVLATERGRQLSYVIGYAAGRPGGPRRLVDGRAPAAGEAVLDRLAADDLGVGVGGSVEILGTRFTVSGLSSGGTSIVNTTAFISAADFARLRGPSPSYLLVGAAAGVSAAEVRDRLARALPAATVQTRAEFVRQESAIVADMSADLMRIMALVSYAIALAVVGLMLFSLTLSRLREYAVARAIGARPGRLAAVVLAQAGWSVAAAVALAAVLAVAVARGVAVAAPSLSMAVTAGSVARAAGGAAVVAALGAAAPLRHVLAVDPASAFRRRS